MSNNTHTHRECNKLVDGINDFTVTQTKQCSPRMSYFVVNLVKERNM